MLNCYTRDDVLMHIQAHYYEYMVMFPEVPPSYSHGGIPEDGVYYCRDCGAVSNDGHNNACRIEDEYNKFVSIIEELA